MMWKKVMCNKKKIKVILCGGGTGGHIFPMISVASQFRKVNKENENRRAISSFIANLLLNNEVDVATVITLIFKLQQMLLDNIKDKMKTEEITENLFYLITIGLESIVITDEWGNIYDFMQSNSTRKDLSNKIRFRFMDMLDYTDKSM